MQQAAFALFDFDDTLSRGDSIIPYLFYCIRRGVAPRRQFFRALWAVARRVFRRTTDGSAKAEALSFLAGRRVEEMDDIARGFYREVLSRRMYPAGLEELQRLRDAGMRILLVSASPEAYMRVLPEFLPIDSVIATPCGITAEGCYNGLMGENCKGIDKPLRIAEYLAANHLTLDYAASRAYGDSPSDEPMLSLTATPLLVNPKPKLKRAMPEAAVLRWR